MNKNGWRLSLISTMLVLFMVSCDKDDVNSGLFDKRDSKMMNLMHSMMKSIDSLTMSNDPDNDFALMMREHHKGAIDMGNLELKEGSDATLQQISKEMILKQQKEIASLDSFLVVHAKADNNPNFRQMANEAMKKMMNNAELQALTGNTDHDFAALMIQHHQGAIDMSDLQIYNGHSDGLKKLADRIRKEQQKEIIKLQEWLIK